MQVEVDKIVPSPKGLRLGCVARYGDDGPVRFVEVLLPYDLFTGEVVFEIGKALDRALDREPREDPLF